MIQKKMHVLFLEDCVLSFLVIFSGIADDPVSMQDAEFWHKSFIREGLSLACLTTDSSGRQKLVAASRLSKETKHGSQKTPVARTKCFKL